MDVHGLQRALKLVGCPLGVDDLAKALHRPDLAAELGRYTDIRHRVIHRGENVRVTKEMASDCAELVWYLVGAIDDAVAAKYYADG
jgi:hypothetical protein